MGPDFTEEQKRYIEGFFAGLLTRRGAGTSSPATGPGANGALAMAPAEPAPSGPEAIHRAAQDRFLTAGKKLTAEEMAKRAKNPLDMWEEMRANAEAGRFPKAPMSSCTSFTDCSMWRRHRMPSCAGCESRTAS
jgi:ferredoxin-nitrite reductase